MNTTLRWIGSLLLGVLLVGGTGCAWFKPKARTEPAAQSGSTTPTNKPPAKPIITPMTSPLGKVISVNVQGQFVVVNLQAGEMPPVDQKLNAYRAGLKVGELKVSKERMGLNLVADIVAGEARVGDEVRPD